MVQHLPFGSTPGQWTGPAITYGQYFDAANSAPVQDRLLFDLFTTAFNDNATRGTLSVNQNHLAAWSALFSGVMVLSNNASTMSAWVFRATISESTPVAFGHCIIQPAGLGCRGQIRRWPKW